MKIQIVVEGNSIDLSQDPSLAMTYAVDDVAQFAARNTSYSKTITIPGSANNNFIFGNIFDVNVYNVYNSSAPNVGYNYNAAKAAGCVIYNDNIQIFKGVIRIMEITVTDNVIEYECAVFGELGGFISAMGDKLLDSLDFSSLNHNYNETNVINSWNAPGNIGYYYGLIDYGYTWDGVNFDITHFRPGLYVRDYLDKIITGAGYTWKSTFMDSLIFKQLVVPYNGDFMYLEVDTMFHKRYIGIPLSIGSTSPYTVTYNGTIGTQYMSESGGTFTFTRNAPAILQFTATARVSGQDTSGTSHTVSVRIYKNGSDSGIGATFNVTPLQNFVLDFSLNGSLQLTTGDTVKLVVTSDSPSSFTNYLLVNSDFKGGGNPTLKINAVYNDPIPVNGCIPKNVLQKDFFASILNMFNLYITEDPLIDKRLNITPQKDFFELSLANAREWTSKLNVGDRVSIKPLGELNSRFFEYKYKDDTDYYNDLYKRKYTYGYGNLIYDTGLEFVKNRQSVELVFSGTPMVNVSGNTMIAPAIYKVTQDNTGTLKKQYTSNIRILFRSSTTVACNTWNLKNGGATLSGGLIYYPYIGHLDTPASPQYDLNWGAPFEIYFSMVSPYPSGNLFNVYWSGYMSEITNKDSKMLTALFNLDSMDISILDFSKLIRIGGQVWRLNQIIDYNPQDTELTECELVNVINLL